MMTSLSWIEDYYSVWNNDTRTIDLVANQNNDGMTFVPIVAGSIVGESVATTDLYPKSSTLNRHNKDLITNQPGSRSKMYCDDDDITEFWKWKKTFKTDFLSIFT